VLYSGPGIEIGVSLKIMRRLVFKMFLLIALPYINVYNADMCADLDDSLICLAAGKA
jgi:hypothetical protein